MVGLKSVVKLYYLQLLRYKNNTNPNRTQFFRNKVPANLSFLAGRHFFAGLQFGFGCKTIHGIIYSVAITQTKDDLFRQAVFCLGIGGKLRLGRALRSVLPQNIQIGFDVKYKVLAIAAKAPQAVIARNLIGNKA